MMIQTPMGTNHRRVNPIAFLSPLRGPGGPSGVETIDHSATRRPLDQKEHVAPMTDDGTEPGEDRVPEVYEQLEHGLS